MNWSYEDEQRVKAAAGSLAEAARLARRAVDSGECPRSRCDLEDAQRLALAADVSIRHLSPPEDD